MSSDQSDIQKFGVLYEDMQADIKKILELVKIQTTYTKRIPKMDERIEKLEKAIDHLDNHDHRIAKLEAKLV